jgi:hypothetical protein
LKIMARARPTGRPRINLRINESKYRIQHVYQETGVRLELGFLASHLFESERRSPESAADQTAVQMNIMLSDQCKSNNFVHI